MEVAIELNEVTKEYPGVRALNNISFQVASGKIHGFLGPNGAGKSTTMKIIAGLIPPTSGQVRVMGLEVRKNLQKINKMIGFLPENPPLYENMTVKTYLEFVANINGNDAHEVHSIMGRCGLAGVSTRLIGNLSKGYKQRVGIAQGLVYSPSIIILDEPTVGLDPVSIVEIRELILSLRGERTIFLSTHQLHEANQLCSDVTIINDGRILQSGPIEVIEQKFQVQQVVVAEVTDWSEQVRDCFQARFPCEGLEIAKGQEATRVRIFTKGSDDRRSEMSRFLSDYGLLSFGRERIDLEEIFKMATDIDKGEQ